MITTPKDMFHNRSQREKNELEDKQPMFHSIYD